MAFGGNVMLWRELRALEGDRALTTRFCLAEVGQDRKGTRDKVLKAFAKTMMAAGAIIFLVGDKLLRAIWNVPFVTAEVIGIGGGIGVMLLGLAAQSRSSETEDVSDDGAVKPGDLES